MSKTKAWALLLLAAVSASVVLGACGGDSDESASAPTEQTPSTVPEGGAGGDGEGAPEAGRDRDPSDRESSAGATGKGQPRAGSEEPASLETDPGSIQGARVTSTGAVQTLPPSEVSHEEAMENSYSSIKSFGSEIEGPEASDITFALVQYLRAKASGDWATACARLYSVLRENLEKGNRDCADTYGMLLKRASKSSTASAAQIDVASIRRGEGNRAFVIYKTPDTLSADMPMYLDAGVWTVGALEAYVLTEEQLHENQG